MVYNPFQTGGMDMLSVTGVSKITGISVRTLHHYDAIGLLKPSRVSEAGYRFYDEEALKRLQTILLFRQLQFPLKQIKTILDNPDFDRNQALSTQIRLLELQREHLDNLIRHARQIQKEGVNTMDFSAFSNRKFDEYAAEAKEKWGKTDAYREFREKTAGQTPAQMESTGDSLMDIFVRLGAIRHMDPTGPEAQSLVKQLQSFITEHYYNCTTQILRGLGQMYVAGDSMTVNINAAGGDGTAEFASQAIAYYCK